MQPIITLKNIYKNYGYKQVLKNINVDIYPGQVIGYIGPNGAGKSTTVKILCGLINDFDGEAIIKGYDVKKNPLEVKKHIGYIPELAELYDVLTPFEFLNIMGELYNLPANVVENRMNTMLTAFGLQDNIHQRMDTFSKGMKQKVLITSGLIHNPDIIILDEPLSGLDANSVIIIKDLISKLAQDGKTIFYCSHMMDIVEKVSDKIVLINEGTVIANGTFLELQQQQGDMSLESIFAQLTAKENLGDAANELVNALK
ncbi:MAG: ABC transporter ATP-binding protein [Chitinophagaceae bacterium]